MLPAVKPILSLACICQFIASSIALISLIFVGLFLGDPTVFLQQIVCGYRTNCFVGRFRECFGWIVMYLSFHSF